MTIKQLPRLSRYYKPKLEQAFGQVRMAEALYFVLFRAEGDAIVKAIKRDEYIPLYEHDLPGMSIIAEIAYSYWETNGKPPMDLIYALVGTPELHEAVREFKAVRNCCEDDCIADDLAFIKRCGKNIINRFGDDDSFENIDIDEPCPEKVDDKTAIDRSIKYLLAEIANDRRYLQEDRQERGIEPYEDDVPKRRKSLIERIDGAVIEQIKARLSNGEWRRSPQSKAWVGKPCADVLKIDLSDARNRSKVDKMVKAFIEKGFFETYEGRDSKRNVREFVRPSSRTDDKVALEDKAPAKVTDKAD